MHYYQFNIGDYRKDTAHLSPIEHYIYRTLIDWYYLDEKPIAKETQVVMRRLSIGNEGKESLKNVLQDFFILMDDGWNHEKINAVIYKYHATTAKNRENGKKGGRPKKQQVTGENKPRKTQPVSLGMPEETAAGLTSKQVNQEPRTKNQEPLTTNQSSPGLNAEPERPSCRFNEWWKEYPIKSGKKACLKKWTARNLDDIADKLIADVKNRNENHKPWIDGYVPDPLTYINGDRWEDEIRIKPQGADHAQSNNIRRTLSAPERVRAANKGSGSVTDF